jgi:hypothetical protein
MNCSQFQKKLEESIDLEQVRIEFAEHLKKCSKCRKAFEIQLHLHKSLASLSPDKATRERILSNTLNKISPDSFINKFSYMAIRGLIMVLVIIVLTISGYLYFIVQKTKTHTAERKKNKKEIELPELKPKQIILATIKGNFIWKKDADSKSIRKNFQEIHDQGEIIYLHNQNYCELITKKGKSVKIISRAVFYLPDPRTIAFKQANCRLDFEKSGKGYKIKLPDINVFVRGTSVRLFINGVKTMVWIDEGVVEWQSLVDGKKGILRKNMGLIHQNSELRIVHDSPFEEDKEIKPIEDKNKTLPKSDRQNNKKTNKKQDTSATSSEPLLPIKKVEDAF